MPTEAEDRLQEIKELSPLPLAARYILQALRGEETNINELVSSVELEPVVTARLLAVSNSAFYKTSTPCSSVKDAIVRIGLEEAKQLLLSIVVSAYFDLKKCSSFRADRYWEKALLVGMGARKLAECASDRLLDPIVRSAYTAGLLHNIGLLALVHCFPDEINNLASSTDVNNTNGLVESEIGIDPGNAGFILLSNWNVPENICVVARDVYHDTSHQHPEQLTLTEIVKFIIAWYTTGFADIQISSSLKMVGFTTADIDKAQTLILDNKDELMKLASLLHYY